MHFRIGCATILVIFCPLKDFVMHRHITYYTQSTVCQGGFSNKFLSIVVHGRMQDLPRGATIFYFIFFLGGGLATREVATRLLGGSGACFPEKVF